MITYTEVGYGAFVPKSFLEKQGFTIAKLEYNPYSREIPPIHFLRENKMALFDQSGTLLNLRVLEAASHPGKELEPRGITSPDMVLVYFIVNGFTDQQFPDKYDIRTSNMYNYTLFSGRSDFEKCARPFLSECIMGGLYHIYHY